MNRYLLDTNIFIEAKNRHFGLDFCPGFRDWLVVKNQGGIMASLDVAKVELMKRDDDLAKWASTRGKACFRIWMAPFRMLWQR